MSDTQELLLKAADIHERLAVSLRRDAKAMSSRNGAADPLARAEAIHPKMGFRQREVLEQLIEAGDSGTDMGKVQRALKGITESNVHLTLARLMDWGFVRKDELHKPQLYFVGERIK